MTLMELLVYIGLLAIIMTGSVFASYSIFISVETSNSALQADMKNHQNP